MNTQHELDILTLDLYSCKALDHKWRTPELDPDTISQALAEIANRLRGEATRR